MLHPVTIDIIKLLNQLVSLLQPFAECHGIKLLFTPKEDESLLLFRPDLVIKDITSLVCNIISYLPQGNTVTISVAIEENGCKIQVSNTGINLSLVSEITKSINHQLIVTGNTASKQTIFEWSLPLRLPGEDQEKNDISEGAGDKKIIPEYYDEIRKRLRSHFSKADNLVAQLSILYPREASFMQKVNAVIVSNMENELFDATALSREMNMSRASLFRRLKPLIQQAPASYIKSIRLQKAKEFLETTDISVGEVASKTGFQTQSHFTKAFKETFGFLPSSIRLKNRGATKE